MFAWVWLCILQSRNCAESVNPGTICDGAPRGQHSPLRGRPLFIPVMSTLLGISAGLHTVPAVLSSVERPQPGERWSAPVNHNHKDQLAAVRLRSHSQMLSVFLLPTNLPPRASGLLYDSVLKSHILNWKLFSLRNKQSQTTAIWSDHRGRCGRWVAVIWMSVFCDSSNAIGGF